MNHKQLLDMLRKAMVDMRESPVISAVDVREDSPISISLTLPYREVKRLHDALQLLHDLRGDLMLWYWEQEINEVLGDENDE